MSSARPSSSAVLHVLGRLSLLLPLLLWPVPAAVRGDCGLPPDLPNATPDLRGVSTFAPGDTVTYKCDTNFVKIPGLSDTATCQDTYQWSEMQPFCNRSCNDPPHLIYASLKRPYRDQNYFPVGSTVEYECRLGYKRDQGRPTITCLESLEWSQPEQFCTKKRCPHPGELTNGDIKIETDILFGSTIYFSCDLGYQLIGEKSSFCLASENGVNWSNKLPICREVQCPDPPPIENGRIREESATYSYRQVVSYQCDKGFVMVGNGNTFCNEEGAWSTPLPECRGKNAPPKATVSTTENVPSTPRPTQSNGPSIEVPPTTRKPSSTSTSAIQDVSVTMTTKHTKSTPPSEQDSSSSGASKIILGIVPVIVIVGILILVKIGWDCGKSGNLRSIVQCQGNSVRIPCPVNSYSTHESKAFNVKFHNVNETDDASEVRLSDKV
ncbi:complement decay-accelerating factor isoform X3 [Ochotona curzoniae]|uniref:complement decay-accelerating factor isoform X3 n=1 Tax=Ochotona curzoniae TaxID=130825 RepID=UPI001B348569|nr:complement decay-accelerating factor isoform X3 [Ochotona curzoniae]